MSRTMHHAAWLAAGLLGATAATAPALATESEQELARQLTNPVAALISVPFQLNYNGDVGPADDGEQWVLNIQPVIPFSLNDEWNLISRTILPVVDQTDIFPGAGSQSGIGDTVQSLFFSPKAPTADGWIWGAGPVFLLPTGTEDLLTTDKWGIGPTGVALRQQGPWTIGVLANHIWSFAGESARDDINATFIQPFMSFTTPTAWTYTLQSESTWDWETSQWQVPVRGVVSKVTRVGGQLMSVAGGVNYWVQSTNRGPEGWGFRITVTMLLPR